MILVTGAAGYIGSQIVHHLYRLHDQPKVIGVDNLSAGYTCNLPRGFECFHGDVGHPVFMANLIRKYKVKQIVHCAASISVPESVAKPLDYYRNNALNTLGLASVAISLDVEGFVFSSTAAVYGDPEFKRPMREDDRTVPCSPYGWSKLCAEQMLRDLHKAHGMSTVILRYFNVAGADPLMQTGSTSPKATHLIKRACQAKLGMGKLEIYGDGSAVRDYIHVADLADAHIGALDWAARHNDCLTLNVGTGKGYSVMAVLHRFPGITWTMTGARPGDPQSIVADPRLIREKFNWKPKYGLDEMVEHALRWERTL